MLPGDDLILCQITSQAVSDADSIPIDNLDMASGGLNLQSNIRPNKLFTADNHIVLYSAGRLKQEKQQRAVDKIIEILRR